MIKTLGIILILITSSFGGFYYGEALRRRAAQLKEMQRGLQQLQNEIIYTHSILEDSFDSIARKSKSPLSEVFNTISLLLKHNKVDSAFEAFSKSFAMHKGKLNFTKEDEGILLDLACTLGESDISGQINIFILAQENLKKQILAAEIKRDKNIKMYRYLGFALGAVTIIILI